MKLNAGERQVWISAYVARLHVQERDRSFALCGTDPTFKKAVQRQEQVLAASYANDVVVGIRELFAVSSDASLRETLASVLGIDDSPEGPYR